MSLFQCGWNCYGIAFRAFFRDFELRFSRYVNCGRKKVDEEEASDFFSSLCGLLHCDCYHCARVFGKWSPRRVSWRELHFTRTFRGRKPILILQWRWMSLLWLLRYLFNSLHNIIQFTVFFWRGQVFLLLKLSFQIQQIFFIIIIIKEFQKVMFNDLPILGHVTRTSFPCRFAASNLPFFSHIIEEILNSDLWTTELYYRCSSLRNEGFFFSFLSFFFFLLNLHTASVSEA